MNAYTNSSKNPDRSKRMTLSPSRSCRQILLGACAAVAVWLPGMSRAAVVLQDQFDYSTNAALQANWTSLSGNAPTMVLSNTAVAGEPFASLGNGVIQRSLLESVDNFTLTMDLISSQTSRRQTVGVFDASGRNGYTFSIDSNYLVIRETAIPLDQALTWQNYNTYSTAITGSGISGNSGYFPPLYVTPGLVNFLPASPTSETPMTTFAFSLSEGGAIDLYANGTHIFTGSDTTLTSFSSVVIVGMDWGYFNNLTVEAIPEPTTALLVSASAAGFLLRRRQVGLRRK